MYDTLNLQPDFVPTLVPEDTPMTPLAPVAENPYLQVQPETEADLYPPGSVFDEKDLDTGPSDNQLAVEVQAGNSAAFGILYARHWIGLRTRCLKLTGNPDMAEELAQEVMTRAYSHLLKQPDLRFSDDSFVGWLYVIARNKVLDDSRRQKRIAIEPHDEMPEPTRRPESQTSRVDTRAALASVLDTAWRDVPQDFREAVKAVDEEDLTYEEAARRLGIKTGTVRSRIYRGRAAARENLAAAGIHSYSDATAQLE